MFRAECKAGSRLGRRARAILAQGGLIGDEIVNAMVAGRIAREDCRDGFILDGYPRTVAQASFFMRLLEQRALPDPMVIHLDVPMESLVVRLAARRQCPKCSRIYNLLSQPPRNTAACDEDGTALTKREDDCEPAIRERMWAYTAQTGPVLDWFGESAVRRVDGGLSPSDVAATIETLIMRPALRRRVG
jgi:adenylate kinase